MKTNREGLLKELQAVAPGLSPREIIEQSSCFVFKDKKVMTYNDEIAGSFDTTLDIEGAVVAEALIGMLQKLSEEEVTIIASDGELRIEGKHKSAGIRMENEILLPVDELEQPKKWMDLPADFGEAVNIVQYSAGTDEAFFNTMCINITPDFIEACDNYQICRYKTALTIKEPILVKSTTLKHIIPLGMTKFGVTKSWLHFKNPGGLVLSCRTYLSEDYPTEEITKWLATKGTPTQLPKGLKEVIDRASVFTSKNSEEEEKMLTVHLEKGKLRIVGRGVSGWYKEKKKMKYDGEEMSFSIAPQLLSDLSQKYSECEVSSNKLKVEGGKFTYITVLHPIKKKKK